MKMSKPFRGLVLSGLYSYIIRRLFVDHWFIIE
jgi:hypothetical protein